MKRLIDIIPSSFFLKREGWGIMVFSLLLLCSCSTGKQPATVYICTGLTGDAYHSSASCKGLSTCDGELGEVTAADAREIGLHPCSICKPK